MADSVLKLKVDDKEYNASLKNAKTGMQALEASLQKAGKTFNDVDKSVVEYVRAIGNMETQSKSARGRIGEMSTAFVELSQQYNKMTKDVQSSDVGKALAASMGTLKDRTIEAKRELEQLESQLKEVNNTGLNLPDMTGGSGSGFLSGLGGKMGGALQVFAGNMMTKAAGWAMDAVSEMQDLVAQSIEVSKAAQGIEIAYKRLNQPGLLDNLKEATHGTVSELELMKAAVKFNDFKLPLEDLGTYLAFAQQKAKDTGESVDYMVNSIVTGLGRQSKQILDNLGISASEITAKMKDGGDMTKAVAEIIREKMAAAGDYVETAADRASKANADLENAMKRLGDTFSPLTESASSMWSSIKTGALDVLNYAVRPLIDALTKAGQLRKTLGQLNGVGDGGPTEVEKQLQTLRVIRSGGGSQYMLDATSQGQIEQYNRQVNAADKYVMQFEQNRSKINSILQQAGKEFGQKFGSISELEAYRDAFAAMRDEYRKGAAEIVKPVTADIDTETAQQNVDTLKKKLKELEKQRRDAVKAGDQGKVDDLTKQISQTKTNLGYLSPSAIKTGSGGTTPAQRAAENIKAAEQEYSRALEKAAMEVDNGRATTADAKKAEYNATMALWTAYSKAADTFPSNEGYRQRMTELEASIKTLGGEVTQSAEAQKKAQDAARELELAQKKLAEAQSELATARESGSLKDIYKAQGKVTSAEGMVSSAQAAVERLKPVEVPVAPKWMQQAWAALPAETKKALARIGRQEVPVDVPATPGNIDAFIGSLKERLSESEAGTALYNNLTAQLADATALGNLLDVAIKNGIDVMQFEPQKLWKKIFSENPGDYLGDDAWESIMAALNAQIEARGGTPVTLDTQTGSMRERGDDGGTGMERTQKLVSGLNAVSGGLQQMGIQLPSEVQKVLGVVQGLMTVVQGVQTVISVFGSTTQAANTVAVSANSVAEGTNTGALVSLTAAVIANTAALSTNSALKFLPWANGGIVHAAGGWAGTVPGDSYSGDLVPAMLNSGELVLNRSQQGVLADALTDGGRTEVVVRGVIDGDALRLVQEQNDNLWGRSTITD